jgi:hypothetical protein
VKDAHLSLAMRASTHRPDGAERSRCTAASVAIRVSHRTRSPQQQCGYRPRMLARESLVDAQLAERNAQSAQARKAATAVQEDTRVLREEIERKRN